MSTPKSTKKYETPKKEKSDFSLLLNTSPKKSSIGFIVENMTAPQVVKVMMELQEYFRDNESEKDYPIGYSGMFAMDDSKPAPPEPRLLAYLPKIMSEDMMKAGFMDAEEYTRENKKENLKIAVKNQQIVADHETRMRSCNHQAFNVILGQIHDTCIRKLRAAVGGEETFKENDPVKLFRLIKANLLTTHSTGSTDEATNDCFRKFFTMKQYVGDDVVNYNARMRSTLMALESNLVLKGEKTRLPSDKEQIAQYVNGLWPERFSKFIDEFRTCTSRFDDIKTLRDMMDYVESWEKKIFKCSKARPQPIHHSTPSSSDRAIYYTKGHVGYKCFICGKVGHGFGRCTQRNKDDPEQCAMIEKALNKARSNKSVAEAEKETKSDSKDSSHSKRKN